MNVRASNWRGKVLGDAKQDGEFVMKHLPVNPTRAIWGIISLAGMMAGAWMLWGDGAALFAGGLFTGIDLSIDEAIERITNTNRGGC